MKPEERRQHAIAPGTIACDGETMPSYMLVKRDFAAGSWPLFFLTHGGGSTDDTLPHPHAWPREHAGLDEPGRALTST